MKEVLDIRGFVDLQVNGYKGIDFSSPELTEDTFVFACRELEKKGTVAFLPTIISSAPEVYQKNLKIISRIKRREEFEHMLPGIHLEGPFISAENGYKGIHPLQQIRRPDLGILRQLIKWSDHQIRMITMAAELEAPISYADLLSRRTLLYPWTSRTPMRSRSIDLRKRGKEAAPIWVTVYHTPINRHGIHLGGAWRKIIIHYCCRWILSRHLTYSNYSKS
jgi:hypothetical protein